MRINTIVRSTSVAVGIAAAFALGGCGSLPGQSNGEDASDARVEETTPAETPATEAATAPVETGEPEGTSTSASEPAGDPEDPWADKAKTRSWASDDGIKVDKHGNGTIPATSLEADLVDLFTNKYGLEIKEAKCDDDLQVENWTSFLVSCEVVATDMSYFGTVELVDHKDKMIQYEVLFPGINEEDLDLQG